MAKFQSPLLGYNNNVRHRGRVFHVQTEDSGVKHPHVITHLFMDGGRILKSVKRSYAEHVDSETMSETVRALMKEQHKAMVVALRDGQFDDLVEGTRRPSGATVAPASATTPDATVAPASMTAPDVTAPASVAAATAASVERARDEEPATTAASVERANDEEPPATTPELTTTEARTPASIAPEAAIAGASDLAAADVIVPDAPAVETPVAEGRVAETRVAGARPAASHELRVPDVALAPDAASLPPEIEALLREDAPNTTPEPEERGPAAQDLTLDFDALGHAPDDGLSSIYRQTDLPPPPTSLFAKEARAGSYRGAGEVEREVARVPTNRPQSSSGARREAMPPAATRSSAPRVNEARYASARPASIFGSTTKASAPPSIFSDDLVNDKSLDEVILSYLAEDLDPPARE